MADARGHEIARVARGVNHATGFRGYSWHSSSTGAEQFVAHLRCEHRSGCHRSDVAKTWLRNVHLEVADYADPRFEVVGGSLLQGSWLRGEQSVFALAHDSGSGLQAITLTVNGINLNRQRGMCSGIAQTAYAMTFAVCSPELETRNQPITSRSPFHDGVNSVSVCAFDFALNRTCLQRKTRTDNTPPSVAFTNSQIPNDPELIRALVADPTSGVEDGRILYRAVGTQMWRPLATMVLERQLRARIDSTLDPPGRYEFLAEVEDAAGNVSRTGARANSQRMILTFPLKSGVRLTARLPGGSPRLTLGYGQRAKVSGFLTDPAGEPLTDEAVTVTEYFGEGALIDRRVRTVRTDAHGRWMERLPTGPSRKIVASYAGTRRYLPDTTRAGSLRIKTKATFHLSRRHVLEGHRVSFKGRVGHLAARIPSGGKLVELEVKDGKHWQTVRRPFYTRPSGRYRLHYRFARFYVRNVRYRFRIRVLRERNWPYKTPVSSRVRELVVKAR